MSERRSDVVDKIVNFAILKEYGLCPVKICNYTRKRKQKHSKYRKTLFDASAISISSSEGLFGKKKNICLPVCLSTSYTSRYRTKVFESIFMLTFLIVELSMNTIGPSLSLTKHAPLLLDLHYTILKLYFSP